MSSVSGERCGSNFKQNRMGNVKILEAAQYFSVLKEKNMKESTLEASKFRDWMQDFQKKSAFFLQKMFPSSRCCSFLSSPREMNDWELHAFCHSCSLSLSLSHFLSLSYSQTHTPVTPPPPPFLCLHTLPLASLNSIQLCIMNMTGQKPVYCYTKCCPFQDTWYYSFLLKNFVYIYDLFISTIVSLSTNGKIERKAMNI